jgi:FkbM family methyltransferase
MGGVRGTIDPVAGRIGIVLRVLGRWVVDGRVSLGGRLAFLGSAAVTLWSGGRVRLFGRWFRSDNRAALLLLPGYVGEVRTLLDHVGPGPGGRSPRLLDVGANVGQFAFVFRALGGGEVVSCEPNPSCLPYLEANRAGVPGWQVVPVGVSDAPGVAVLYAVPGKSAQGSLSASNAEGRLLRRRPAQPVEIELDTAAAALRRAGVTDLRFDIVKLDVEGHELAALRGLAGIDFAYLLVEVDEVRANGFTEADVEACCRRHLGLVVERRFADPPQGETRNVLFAVRAVR